MENEIKISRGMWVYTNLYNKGHGVVYGFTKDEKEAKIVFENGSVSVIPLCMILKNGGSFKPVHDRNAASDDVITMMLEVAEQKKIEAEAEEKEADRIFGDACDKLRNSPDHKHLIQLEYFSGKEVAKNIRADLKKNFPGCKFSVRCRRGGSSSIDVDWTDGPTLERVDSIVMTYQHGNYDGMTECYNHSNSPFNVVFGGVSYVMTSRSYSDELKTQAIEKTIAKYGNHDDHDVSLEKFNSGCLYNISPVSGGNTHYWSWQSLIYQQMKDIDCYEQPTATATADQNSVTLPHRVDKETFKKLCQLARSHKGGYSRKEQKFKFKNENDAQNFKAQMLKPALKTAKTGDGIKVIASVLGHASEFVYTGCQSIPDAISRAIRDLGTVNA